MAKTDWPAVFLSRAMETDSRRVVAAVSFAVRFSPGTDLFAVVLFGLCRCPRLFAIAGFGPAAADLFDPADSGFAAAAVVVVVVAAAAAAAAAVVVVVGNTVGNSSAVGCIDLGCIEGNNPNMSVVGVMIDL